MINILALKTRTLAVRLPLALAFVGALLFIGYSLSPDSGSAQETSGEEITATPHPPESENDISEDEVAGEEEGASGAHCHTEAGMFTCDDRHDDTPTPTPTSVSASPTPTPTPTPRQGNGGGTTPGVPTGLTSTAEPGRINLDWDTVANATGYAVYQWSGYPSTNKWYKLPFYERPSSSRFRISFRGSSATITGVTGGVCYSHFVRSKRGGRYSGWSSTISTCVPTPTPTPTYTPIPNTPTHTPTPIPPTPTRTPIPATATDTPTPTPTPVYTVSITKTLPGVTSMYLEWETSGWSGQDPPPANIRWCKKISFRPDPCSNTDAGRKTSYLLTGLEDDRGYDLTVRVNVGTGTSEVWIPSDKETAKTHPAPTLSAPPGEVPVSAKVTLGIVPTVTSHQFALEVQPGTGLQTGSGCVWGLSATPTPSWQSGQSPSVQVTRCGVGDGSSTVTIKVRDATPIPASGTSSETDYFSYTIAQAWHQRDNAVTYRIEATPTPEPSATPMPSVQDAAAIAAAIWNSPGLGIKICEQGSCSISIPDGHTTSIEVVKYIATKNCTAAVACHIPGGSYPDIGNTTIQIENPPIEGGSSMKRWFNDLAEARTMPHQKFYLPVYIAHELGHAAGLQHHQSGIHLMLSPNQVIGETGVATPLPGLMSDDDEEAMKSIYHNHAAH